MFACSRTVQFNEHGQSTSISSSPSFSPFNYPVPPLSPSPLPFRFCTQNYTFHLVLPLQLLTFPSHSLASLLPLPSLLPQSPYSCFPNPSLYLLAVREWVRGIGMNGLGKLLPFILPPHPSSTSPPSPWPCLSHFPFPSDSSHSLLCPSSSPLICINLFPSHLHQPPFPTPHPSLLT